MQAQIQHRSIRPDVVRFAAKQSGQFAPRCIRMPDETTAASPAAVQTGLTGSTCSST